MSVHATPTGVLRYEKDLCLDGYNLVSPYFMGKSYIMNNEGEIVHEWNSDYPPGLFAHLMPNGNLVRGIRVPNQAITFAGSTGGFEVLDWNSNVLQRYIKNDPETQNCLSHAFCPMPNGNTMVICLEKISNEEAYARGRKLGTLPDGGYFYEGVNHDGLFLDYLMEIDQNNNVVWEWHLLDHIGDQPDEFNLNYTLPTTCHYFSSVDWVHFNAVDYDPVHDRCVLTCRNFGEIIVVDRKTGKMTHRWGNPSTHNRGIAPSWINDGDQQLWGCHCATWMEDGKNILIHDNGWMRPQGNRSRAVEIKLNDKKPYDGADIVWEYKSFNPSNYTSPYQSSVQRLPNGNTLICSTGSGQIFEVTAGNEPQVVWEFVNPWFADGTIQNFLDDRDVFLSGTSHIIQEGHMKNMIHRVYRYAKDFPAFKGKNLSKSRPIDPCMIRIWETEPYKSGNKRARSTAWPKAIMYSAGPETK